MDSTPTPRIYLGTGGYSDTDLLGTLYPTGTKKPTSYANTPSNTARWKLIALSTRPSDKKPLLAWSIKPTCKQTVS